MRLFDYVESVVRLFPPSRLGCQQVAGRTWALLTQGGVNVPEIDIYFTFANGEVRLQDAFAA